MAEDWVSTREGRHLSGRKKRDTVPEVLLRKALHAQGARFRLQRQIAKGCTPDLVLPSKNVAVFVDGCFWHGCPEHGRRTPWSGPNAALWEEKMRRNQERDARSSQIAEQAGYWVVRVWECTIVRDPGSLAASLLLATEGARHQPFLPTSTSSRQAALISRFGSSQTTFNTDPPLADAEPAG